MEYGKMDKKTAIKIAKYYGVPISVIYANREEIIKDELYARIYLRMVLVEPIMEFSEKIMNVIKNKLDN